ncbi:MAG TPA: ABC transporter permease [Dinghuibacter sp.]|uniref:ABC transporter permease n=1 Tax=Dinghuibacter sp. TaxID=2024697 RepID=UPI002C8A403B|nr:ABC transporter permease [Dinghuibacter sp.]HTJ11714.1 ABC transporter permease [Dinghuibacter sp.]
MFLNYLTSAWRALLKSPLYSAINIGGLSTGLAACMLILLYVTHEHSYDRFHRDSDRLYRVDASFTMSGQQVNIQGIGYNDAPRLLAGDSRVTEALRVKIRDQATPIEGKAGPFTENGFLFADSRFFSFFSFPLVEGDPATALGKPFSVVLSQRAARKYFGQSDPIGQVLTYNHKHPLEVTGVAADAPSNSSIEFDFVTPLSSLEAMPERKDEIGGPSDPIGNFVTYLRLNRPESARGVEKSLAVLARDTSIHMTLELFRDTHLGLNFGDFSNLRYLKVFPLVAFLVLLLALINYMSLATARATTRAKEIGVRKTLGAGRSSVAFQFYTESALYAGLAYAIGFALFLALKPGFLNLLHLSIDSHYLSSTRMMLWLVSLLVVTVLAAGSYPAVVLSSFRPIASIRAKGGGVRKVFTVLQFTISIGLIACSLVMYQQLYFVRHTDTGINRAGIIEVPFTGELGRHFQAFETDVRAVPGVTDVASSSYPLYADTWSMSFVKTAPGEKSTALPMFNSSPNFLGMIGARWAVPPPDKAALADPTAIFLNQQALTELQLPANPVGRSLDVDGHPHIIQGVYKNFNYQSMDYAIRGLGVSLDTFLQHNQPNRGCLYIQVSPHVNLPTLMEAVAKAHARYDPGTAFNYRFLDQAFDALYRSEDRLAGLLGAFTLLTIGIACLGLLGLATFSTLQRTKEIGIRKVLGAGVPGLVRLLSADFLWLVGVAVLLALPLAAWVMHDWLTQFAYKITLSPVTLGAAALGAVLLAALTVGTQALRAARANPVDSLRSE